MLTGIIALIFHYLNYFLKLQLLIGNILRGSQSLLMKHLIIVLN